MPTLPRRDEPTRDRSWALAVLLAVALAVRVWVASASPTVLWPDEIFQSLEQAHRFVFGPGIVPWEFRVGARSWALPLALAGIMKLCAPLAGGSTGYLLGVRLVLSALSLTVPAVSYMAARRHHGRRGALVAGLAAAGWFELVFFAPKALTEVVAAHLLVPGLYLVSVETRGTVRRLVAAGLLVGLAVALRVHLAVAAPLPALLLARRHGPRAALVYAMALVAPVVAVGLLDLVMWGHAFQSFWLNFKANIVDGKSEAYGTSPWHAYVDVFGRVWSWGGLVVVALAAIGARRAVLLAVSAGLILAAHSCIPHKEYRFVYPSLALILVLAALGLAEIGHRLGTLLRARRLLAALTPSFCALAFACLSGLLAVRYDWADASLVGPSGEPTFMWRHLRGNILAFQALADDPTLCGVGLANRRWSRTSGYTHLHQGVPLFEIRSDQAFARYTDAFNVLLVPRDSPESVGRYVRDRCWDEVCVLRRAGGCTPVAGYDLNSRLEKAGE